MQRLRMILLLAALLLGGGAVLAQSGGSYDVGWSVIGNAGEQFVTGGDYQLGFTLAQDTPPLVSTGGDYQIVQGYWSGNGYVPTAVTLSDFWVEVRGDTLVVGWETASEVDLLGFNIYRSNSSASGSFSQLNERLIPSRSPGSPVGATYEWVDAGVEAGQTYFYLLENLDVRGLVTRHGPVSATLQPVALYQIYLPLVNR
jgi:hypothetical protein